MVFSLNCNTLHRKKKEVKDGVISLKGSPQGGGLIITPPQLYKNLLVAFDYSRPPLNEFKGKQRH